MIVLAEILWTLCEVATVALVLAVLVVTMLPEPRKEDDE